MGMHLPEKYTLRNLTFRAKSFVGKLGYVYIIPTLAQTIQDYITKLYLLFIITNKLLSQGKCCLKFAAQMEKTTGQQLGYFVL